ncbi:AAA family ATPase [Roseococcus sp. YIM B11640]|uniref:bifunctional aminoglycoside phosphotransferase/ATP-binding protein n=1 Tax=Roseococcus sp. YIM B11640 TaxID=3133973 RepID=UPI003C7BA341
MTIPAEQREVADFLTRLTGQGIIETHISAVFLGAEEALKLKKAVKLTFLDFTRLSERERLVRFEQDLNHPMAPALYLGCEKITRGAGGALRLGGEGEALEWVLRLRRLPPSSFLDHAEIDPAWLDPMADAVAALHASAPRREGDGSLLRIITENAEAGRAAELPEADVALWKERILALHGTLAPWFAGRARDGFLRRCHGDLHLGNLCLLDGRPTPFDALEFDEAMATIDTGYDLAFLLMDLERRAGRAAANRVLNRYVALTGDAALARGLPLWLSLRAFIRAHVAGKQKKPHVELLQAALSYLEPAGPPRLIAIGGLQGTGKSVLARAIAPGLGAAPGALILRSDEIRKRRAGTSPETRLPAEAYAPEASAAVFAELNRLALAALQGGQDVIADAVFQRAGERQALEELWPRFTGIWLQAPLAVLRARVAARRGDASDADAAVLEAAAARDPGPLAWHQLDATSPPEVVARKMLDLLASSSP